MHASETLLLCKSIVIKFNNPSSHFSDKGSHNWKALERMEQLMHPSCGALLQQELLKYLQQGSLGSGEFSC